MHLTEKAEAITEIGTSLDTLVDHCKKKGYGLALWRLPNEADVHLIVSFQPQLTFEKEVEKLPAGFLVGAFGSVYDKKKTFLPADIYVKFPWEELDQTIEKLAEKLPDFKLLGSVEAFGLPDVQPSFPKESTQIQFERLVQKAIESIQEGQFKKVVLARSKTVAISPYFSFTSFWETLCQEYANTFNSLVWLPENGLWIGATPELLVSKDSKDVFRTVALAGTQKALGRNEKEAVWSQKEIEEQAYVRRYIIDCLKFIRLREFEDIGPKTVRVGHLFHLRTDFIVDMNEVNIPGLVGTLLDLLHPTSAVCGTPKKESLDFIMENEGIDRKLYGGYLGPLNIADETHLFVNLRCLQVQEGTATLFAGAGITEDSETHTEYTETETKMDSLLSLL